MEFIELFKKYLFSQKNAPSKVTVKNYLADVSQFIRWLEQRLGHSFAATEISPDIIEDFKSDAAKLLSASSLDRHLSSLRKFFTFLKLEGHIAKSPFEQPTRNNQQETTGLFHVKDFKNFLYVYNSSHLTIKNYIIDVKQFILWLSKVTTLTDNILATIDNSVIETYKARLLEENVFSPSSINRKLSSLRKYLNWAQEQGLLSSFARGPAARRPTPMASVASLPAGTREGSPVASPLAMKNEVGRYSSFPPFRLVQKMSKGFSLLSDTLIIAPIAVLALRGHKLAWKLQGKPLFDSKNKIQSTNKLNISNLPKKLYAPLFMSVKNLPWYKKLAYHLQYTRPIWYKRYQKYAFAKYVNFMMLFIVASSLGVGIYAGLFQHKSPVAASPVSPLRILSFQGQLTDASDNPITTKSNLRFAIYDDPTASDSGTHRLWEEVDSMSPDSNGIFSILLGSNGSGGSAGICNGGNPPTSPTTGPCGIPQNLFTIHNQLYLGVTVETTPELTPRQQLATVAYATNAETIQGLPPTTDTTNAPSNTNAVLALNGSGTVSISGTANPTTIQYTGNQFNLIGKVLSLQTAPGTNTNIQLIPDGKGYVDIQRPIQNTTNNGNISSVPNAVEVDGLLGLLATSSGQSAFTINQNSTGPLISASTSGNAKFTVGNA